MKRKTFPKSKFIAATMVILGMLIFGFYANEARKEVHYLCGNFSEGTTYSSVIRQLKTSKLSEYKVTSSEQGKRIVHSSSLHFHLISCSININQQDRVVTVFYSSPFLLPHTVAAQL